MGATPGSLEGLRDQLHTAISSARAEGGTEPSTPAPTPTPGGEPAAPAPPPAPAPLAEPQPVAPAPTPAAPPAPVPAAPPATPALPTAAAPATAPPVQPPATPPAPSVEELNRRIAELEAARTPPPPTDDVYLPVRQDGSLDEHRLELLAKAFTGDDPECSSLREGFRADYTVIANSDARLATLADEVQTLTSLLNPDKVKNLGITVELDEMQRSEARNKLNELRNERQDLLEAKRGAAARNQGRETRYDARRQEFVDYVSSQVQSRQEAVATEREVETVALTFERDTRSLFDTEFAALKIPADFKPRVWENVKTRMKVEEYEHEGAALEADLRGFMTGALQAEVANLDAYHRAQSAVYGQQKLNDAVPPGTVLNPSAAVVPTPAGAPGRNWEQGLRSTLKATRANVRAAYGDRR